MAATAPRPRRPKWRDSPSDRRCVAMMARASKSRRSIKIRGVKIYIKSISLLIAIVAGQVSPSRNDRLPPTAMAPIT